MKNFKLRRTAAIIGYTVLAVVLFSCNNIPTRNVIKEPYVIYKIEEWSKGMCKYSISNGTTYAFYNNDISVIDSIGKFTIGDIVFISLNNR